MNKEEFIKKCLDVATIQNLTATHIISQIANADDMEVCKRIACEIARLHKEELKMMDEINLYIFRED